MKKIRHINTRLSIVVPLIQKWVSALEPTLARICLYHLGLVNAHGRLCGEGGGKLTRSSLMMAAAAGVDRAPEDVLSHAAALELLHNATLIHDDIVDHDELRRGRPAAWNVFGVGLAILAGNALENLGLRIVVDDSGPGHVEIARLFTRAIGLVHEGQARELTFKPGPGATTAEYGRIVDEKASALLECALMIPAMRAGKPEHVLAALRAAGQHLGAALQMSNDVEDIWGDPAVTGKPDRGDIGRRNLTLPVVLALAADNPVRDPLLQLWEADNTTEAHLQAIADLIEEAGGRRTAQQMSQDHLDSAVENLRRAELSSTATAELTTLFNLIVNRAA